MQRMVSGIASSRSGGISSPQTMHTPYLPSASALWASFTRRSSSSRIRSVVPDKTAYLPAEVVDANQIKLVSLYVNFGTDRTERESDIADYSAFYDELRGAEGLPPPSQPSLGDFMEVYEPLLADGRDIVSIHLSGGLSGTADAARQAKEALERDG